MPAYIAHLGYVLQLCALLARDILWLRGLLAMAQVILAWYAYSRQIYPIAFWNAVFVVINAVWVVQILRERRAVRLPEELRPLYEKHFAALTPPEFLHLWEWGERKTVRDSRFIVQGQKPDALYFLLAGEAAVRQDHREVARLTAGSFAAEMSLLTGEPTTADVTACGEIEYITWSADKLARIRTRNPVLWTKIQSVLGHDLVEKIMRATATRSAVS